MASSQKLNESQIQTTTGPPKTDNSESKPKKSQVKKVSQES